MWIKKVQVGFIFRFRYFAGMLFFYNRAGFACATCYGDPNSLMAKAANTGTLFLMSLTGLVLGAYGILFFRWSRRRQR